MEFSYQELCINVLLRLGEDRHISGGSIRTAAAAPYLKAIPMLLRDALTLLRPVGLFIEKSADFEASADEKVYLTQKLPDFVQIQEAKCTDAGGKERRSAQYELEDGVFMPKTPGFWHLRCDCFPSADRLGTEIADEERFAVRAEIYAVLPLYIEGKLREISDEDYAMTVLNEFEQRRAELLREYAWRPHASVIRGQNPESGGESAW